MPSFDEKVLSLYARGMSTREIQGHLEELYGTEVSPALISTVTDAVVDDATAWQSRPLHEVYPIVYLFPVKTLRSMIERQAEWVEGDLVRLRLLK